MGTAESDNQKALACVHIEFRFRVADLRNATRQLVVTQSENKDTDVADLLVTESVATFRTALAATDVPVNGIHTGAARLPIPTLKKIVIIAATYKRKEIPILIWDGQIKVGSFTFGHEGIAIGPLPDESLDTPSGASVLDTLALAWLLTPAGVKEHGLARRVEKAQGATEDAIDRAALALDLVRVSREKIAALVEDHIADAGKRLRSSLLK